MTTKQRNRIIAAKAAIISAVIERLHNGLYKTLYFKNNVHRVFMDTYADFIYSVTPEDVDTLRHYCERHVAFAYQHSNQVPGWFDLQYEIMQLAYEIKAIEAA